MIGEVGKRGNRQRSRSGAPAYLFPCLLLHQLLQSFGSLAGKLGVRCQTLA